MGTSVGPKVGDPRKREWFRIGRQFYSCHPSTLAYLQNFWEEHRDVPMLSSFPDVKPVKAPPTYVELKEVPSIGDGERPAL